MISGEGDQSRLRRGVQPERNRKARAHTAFCRLFQHVDPPGRDVVIFFDEFEPDHDRCEMMHRMGAKIRPLMQVWIVVEGIEPARIVGRADEQGLAEIGIGAGADEIDVRQVDFLPERDQQRPDLARMGGGFEIGKKTAEQLGRVAFGLDQRAARRAVCCPAQGDSSSRCSFMSISTCCRATVSFKSRLASFTVMMPSSMDC